MKKLIWLICILGLVSCRTTKYVPVPVNTVKTEYETIEHWTKEYVHDSIFLDARNDTIIKEVYKYRNRDVYHTDTIIRADSIPVPYPVTEVKEVNKIYKWQYGLMGLGILFVLLMIYRVYRMFKPK